MKIFAKSKVVTEASAVILLLVIFSLGGTGCNRATEIQRRNICISNLRIIDAAKNQWALEQHKNTNDVPTWENLLPFLPPIDGTHFEDSNFGTNCPAGGTYTLGRVDENPTCSILDHQLP